MVSSAVWPQLDLEMAQTGMSCNSSQDGLSIRIFGFDCWLRRLLFLTSSTIGRGSFRPTSVLGSFPFVICCPIDPTSETAVRLMMWTWGGWRRRCGKNSTGAKMCRSRVFHLKMLMRPSVPESWPRHSFSISSQTLNCVFFYFMVWWSC